MLAALRTGDTSKGALNETELSSYASSLCDFFFFPGYCHNRTTGKYAAESRRLSAGRPVLSKESESISLGWHTGS
jgi:hypothetical protein